MCGSMVNIRSAAAEIRPNFAVLRRGRHLYSARRSSRWASAHILVVLVHGQVTIIFVVSVGLSVCLFVCLFVCAEFFSAVFDPISIKLGRMLYVWV